MLANRWSTLLTRCPTLPSRWSTPPTRPSSCPRPRATSSVPVEATISYPRTLRTLASSTSLDSDASYPTMAVYRLPSVREVWVYGIHRYGCTPHGVRRVPRMSRRSAFGSANDAWLWRPLRQSRSRRSQRRSLRTHLCPTAQLGTGHPSRRWPSLRLLFPHIHTNGPSSRPPNGSGDAPWPLLKDTLLAAQWSMGRSAAAYMPDSRLRNFRRLSTILRES